MRIAYTRTAQRQLDDIHAFIAQDKPGAATATIQRVKRMVDWLSAFPELGRPGDAPGTRELLIARLPYVIVYEIDRDVVRVLSIVHGAQRQ